MEASYFLSNYQKNKIWIVMLGLKLFKSKEKEGIEFSIGLFICLLQLVLLLFYFPHQL